MFTNEVFFILIMLQGSKIGISYHIRNLENPTKLNLYIPLLRGLSFYISLGEQKGHARNRIPNITNDPTIDIIIISWPKLKIFSVWKWEFLIPKVLYTKLEIPCGMDHVKVGNQIFGTFFIQNRIFDSGQWPLVTELWPIFKCDSSHGPIFYLFMFTLVIFMFNSPGTKLWA